MESTSVLSSKGSVQVTDYEEEYSSYLEQEEGVLVWSLTITRVTPDMAGFYQCEVRLLPD